MFAVYYGEDDYSRKEAVRALHDRLGDPQMASLNMVVVAAAQAQPAEVIAQASAVPFLAPGRLVVVEGLLALFERERSGGPARRPAARGRPAAAGQGLRGWEALVGAAPRIPESNALVLEDGPLSPGNPLLRVLAPVAQVREFRPLRGSALANWVRRRTAERGARLAPEAVQRLVEACGSNLWALGSEIAKLAIYAGGRVVTVQDVESLVSEVREESLFNLVDDVVERRYPRARARLERLVQGGAGTGQVISMLGRQLRMLIAGKDLAAQGASRQEMEEGLGTRSEFALRKALEQGKRFSLEELVLMHRRLLYYDLAIKTGALDETTALELLLAELCRVGSDARLSP